MEDWGVLGESQVNFPPSQIEFGMIPKEFAWKLDSVPKDQTKTFSSWGTFAPSSSPTLDTLVFTSPLSSSAQSSSIDTIQRGQYDIQGVCGANKRKDAYSIGNPT